MECEQVRARVHAYVDGELDVLAAQEIEAHLPGCPACARAIRDQSDLSALIRDRAEYFAAPPGLTERVRAGLASADAGGPRRTLRSRTRREWLAVGLALAATVLLTWAVTYMDLRRVPEQTLEREVIASHVRSLLAQHLTDVASSDRHTVKPWFEGKLDFSPPVRDFPAQGFPLVGGRLDYLDRRAVAALVYRHRKHLINVFLWPATANHGNTPQRLTGRGFHIIQFTHDGMAYWVISDVGMPSLARFAALLQSRG